MKIKAKKFDKHNILYSIFTILLLSSFISQMWLFHNYDVHEKITLPVKYSYLGTFLEDTYMHFDYTKTLDIYKNSEDNSLNNSPIIILIQGDNVEPSSFNLIKRQALKNNFIVVSQKYDYTVKTLYELNVTLNFFKNHDDYKNNPIGVLGHSHGSHFALFISFLRNDILNFSICGNHGNTEIMYNDINSFNSYWEYEHGSDLDWINKESQKNLINFQNSTPANLFITHNDRDPNYHSFIQSIDNQSSFWNISSINELQGDFNLKTARKISIEKTLWSHLSGLYQRSVIIDYMDWIAQSCNIELPQTERKMNRDINYLYILLFGSLLIIVFLTNRTFLLIFNQRLVRSKVKERILYYRNNDVLLEKGLPFFLKPLKSHMMEIGKSKEEYIEEPSKLQLPEKKFNLVIQAWHNIKFLKFLFLFIIINSTLFIIFDFIIKNTIIPSNLNPNGFILKIKYWNERIGLGIFQGSSSFTGYLIIWGMVLLIFPYLRPASEGNRFIINPNDPKMLENHSIHYFKWRERAVSALVLLEIGAVFGCIGYFIAHLWIGYHWFNFLFIFMNFLLIYSLIMWIKSGYIKRTQQKRNPKNHAFVGKQILILLIHNLFIFFPIYITQYKMHFTFPLFLALLNTFLLTRDVDTRKITFLNIILLIIRGLFSYTFLQLI